MDVLGGLFRAQALTPFSFSDPNFFPFYKDFMDSRKGGVYTKTP